MKYLLFCAVILHCLCAYSLSAQWQKVGIGIGSSAAATPVLKLSDRIIAGTTKKIYSKADNDTIWRPVEGSEYEAKELWRMLNSQNNMVISHASPDQHLDLLYVSDDGGATWQQKEIPEKPIPYTIAFDNDTLLMLAYPKTGNTGEIFSTPDWGNSWKIYKNPSFSYSFEYIAKIGNRLFVARRPISSLPYDTVYVGVVRTSDEGENWQIVKKGLDPNVTLLKAKDTVLYAGTWSGLFVSKNYGDDWTFVPGLPSSATQYLDYEGDTLVTLIDNQAYRSIDNGESWSAISDAISIELANSNARPSGITIRHGIIYISTGRGLFSTSDGGGHWKKEQFENLNPNILSILAIDSKIYAGIYNSGLHVSDDKGETWSRIDSNFMEEEIPTPSPNFLTAGENLIYANNYTTNDIYTTPRDSIRWRKIPTQLGTGSGQNYVLGFIEYKGVLIARHTQGLYYSIDNGKSWTKNDSIWAGGGQFVQYGDTLLVPTRLSDATDGIWYTLNGYEWKRYPSSFNIGHDPMSYYNKKDNYEVVRATNYLDEKYSLFSRDGGITWDTLGFSINSIYWSGSQILAAFDKKGIGYSNDSGKTWTLKNAGIEATDLKNTHPYNGYKFTVAGNTIFIYGGTAFYKDALSNYITTSVEETQEFVPEYFYHYPPYPLPSGDQISIKVYWGQDVVISAESVEIYTVLGEKIPLSPQDISFTKQTTSNGTITWNCRNVPEGAYVMKVRHGIKTSAIKMLVAQ